MEWGVKGAPQNHTKETHLKGHPGEEREHQEVNKGEGHRRVVGGTVDVGGKVRMERRSGATGGSQERSGSANPRGDGRARGRWELLCMCCCCKKDSRARGHL